MTTTEGGGPGPLAGYRFVELAGIGPGPFGGMMLADMGAEVVRIDRLRPQGFDRITEPRFAIHNRNRRSVAVDLRHPDAVEIVLRLVERAHGLIEPYRPGVAERLGLGPDVCLARNPALVYGRITGWGQSGPLAKAAGHDINYIALTGALHATGPAGQKPVPPLNLVGDYGGGGMFLAFGLLCGVLSAARTGKGQVVDSAMIDGAALMFSSIQGLRAAGIWADERGQNLLDGGAPFYDTYETGDGKFVAIGPIEPQFYALLLTKLGLTDEPPEAQMDRAAWPDVKQRFADVFRQRTRAEWCEILEGTDACFAPVLSMDEAAHHPHAVAREAYVEVDGVCQAAPGPRFSDTPAAKVPASANPGAATDAVLMELGYGPDEVDRLRRDGIIGSSSDR